MIAHELIPAPDPVVCCERLSGLPYRIFLDSSARGTPLGRYSFLMAEPPWDLYRRLRTQNAAPFSAYLDFPDAVVLSASPERFLRVDAGGHVETRPIKGTRPRGIGPEHDAALGLALTQSAKDRAENLMIVDLIRNDLSRVCAPGTVRVLELFGLEHFATVHHLAGTVRAGTGRRLDRTHPASRTQHSDTRRLPRTSMHRRSLWRRRRPRRPPGARQDFAHRA